MDDIYFSSSFPLNVQLSAVEPKSKGYVTFSTTATVLTQPALKCSLFHSAIYDSHSRSCFPASTYFSVHWLSQRLHMHVDVATSRGPMLFFFSTMRAIYFIYHSTWPTCVTYLEFCSNETVFFPFYLL